MLKRIAYLLPVLALCCWTTARAQDTNAVSAASAPAAAEPKPDPTGTSTGASSDAAAADGTTFIVTAPGELTGDDLREIYVFGSAARGTGDAASDLDLAVSGLPPSVFYRMGACQ